MAGELQEGQLGGREGQGLQGGLCYGWAAAELEGAEAAQVAQRGACEPGGSSSAAAVGGERGGRSKPLAQKRRHRLALPEAAAVCACCILD